ncbi:hypothetical protein NHQ30_010697 [Ciborinia camelliae]|nr:hypothetical protein NHQ30_010697 [Ciborinia camelliae]
MWCRSRSHTLQPPRPWTDISRYEYQPLRTNDTIRILALDPGRHNDPLTGTLEPVDIESVKNFEALSYVWADPGPRNNACILIRNKDDSEGLLKLRGKSIFAALQRLRLRDQPRRIWADQCCINQDDSAERNQQVLFMNRIYRDAVRVNAWLGVDTKKEAMLAFKHIHELDRILKSPHDAVVDLETYIRKNVKALRALTDRRWFRRGWILQEIGTNTPATMMWGDAAIDWTTLASVCEKLKAYHHLRASLGIPTSDICFLFRRFIEPDADTHHANRFNFVYELQRARHLQFSDDRDRVFAFLGHFSTRTLHPLGCGRVPIVADYTKTVEQTYIDVAVRILQANPAAVYIILAAVQHPRYSLPCCLRSVTQNDARLRARLQDKQKLPSWIPDWRFSGGIILAEPICPHRAHGDSTAEFKILEKNNLVLQIHGVDIDKIESCSRPLLSADFYNKKLPGRRSTTIEQLWRDICRKKGFNLDDKYLNGEAAFFAFMQTLSNGCVQAAGHTRRPYHQISGRTWLAKAAKHIVEIMEASDDVSEDIQKAAKDEKSESDDEKWSRWAASAAEDRVFARTKMGLYVLGPAALEAGDIICVLFGVKLPLCLRPMGKYYLLVGECYVHGLMKGETMDLLARDELGKKMFDIV